MEHGKSERKVWFALWPASNLNRGFDFIFALASLRQTGNFMPLDKMVAEANTNLFQKFLWLLHDFTEPQFFAGVVSTFISVASVPAALMLLYGPSLPTLLTGAILGGVIATPTGMLFAEITGFFGLPGVIANVLTMAFTGMAVYSAAIHLPWMKQVAVPPLKQLTPQKDEAEKLSEVASMKWFFKRFLADFSEAQF